MNKLTTPVRRFCQAILRQYPLMKKELAALEEEKQAIAESMPVANWTEPVRAKAVGDRTANQTFKLLRLEENWCKVHFYTKAVEDLLAYLDELLGVSYKTIERDGQNCETAKMSIRDLASQHREKKTYRAVFF